MKEKWTQWKPISNLSNKYYIESIINDATGLTIMFVDSINKLAKLKMVFENGIDAFRITNETFILSTISYLNEKYGDQFYAEWTFFKVENSEYLKFLSEQSGRISDSYGVKKYSIITDEDSLDIVSTYEPKFLLINGL